LPRTFEDVTQLFLLLKRVFGFKWRNVYSLATADKVVSLYLPFGFGAHNALFVEACFFAWSQI